MYSPYYTHTIISTKNPVPSIAFLPGRYPVGKPRAGGSGGRVPEAGHEGD